MKLPIRKKIANLPTPIMEINKSVAELDDVRLFIKRDDFTGIEVTGNKVRKLEYILPEVLAEEADVLITCGGVQSNHCRATAALGAMMGLKTHLLLRGSEEPIEGNYFLSKLFGAEFTFITKEQYQQQRAEIMEEIKKAYETQGLKAYIIPEGASNGLGMFGYYKEMEEILAQEKDMGITFDSICIAIGSGGTYAGLYLANQYLKAGKNIIGINVYDKAKDFSPVIQEIVTEGLAYVGNQEMANSIDFSKITILNNYIELGYGNSTSQEIQLIKDFAKIEGVLLDPVYTGKAMYGLFQEFYKKNEVLKGNILFIHTGGQFGTFPKIREFC